MIPVDKIEQLKSEIDLHKKLAIGYAQALRGDGVTSNELKRKLKSKEMQLRQTFG